MSPPDETEFLAFHEDERRAQALAGQRSGRAAIRPFMPDQHRRFFASLPCLFTATADGEGWPVASVLSGSPGFVHSPDSTTLRIDALPGRGDPAAPGFAVGAGIGLLGLEFPTRRRNRANGVLAAVDDDGMTVRVEQSFGNCPQYIQARTPRPRASTPAPVESLAALDAPARHQIATADTFFVASRSRPGLAGGGFDLSHRGGRPGFVGIEGETLAIPDFRGNRFYNTLGNLLGESRAGLLFVDFETGDLLQVQGRAAVDWQASGGPAGAERLWSLRIERACRRRGAFPLAWTGLDFAPTTLATGTW